MNQIMNIVEINTMNLIKNNATKIPNDTAAAVQTSPRPVVVSAAEFTTLPGPPNAPFVRKQCYDDGHVWMGVVTTEPGSASPWHHHGDYDTFVYALEGEGTLEFGEDGRESVTFKADGSMVLVPKGVVHREVNKGSVPNKAVIMRVGSGPAIVPVNR